MRWLPSIRILVRSPTNVAVASAESPRLFRLLNAFCCGRGLTGPAPMPPRRLLLVAILYSRHPCKGLLAVNVINGARS